MTNKPENPPAFPYEDMLEGRALNRRYWHIGWAIMHMNYWQRLWWALTGQGKYMRWEFWYSVESESAREGK